MINNPPDIAIVLILGLFAFNGFRDGFIEEIGRLISLASGFILASKFHPLLMDYIPNSIEKWPLQAKVAIAYLIVFIVTIIVISIIVKMLQKFIELVLLGWLNRLLGLLLGLLKGFLIVSLVIFIIQVVPFKENTKEQIQNRFNESIMYQICNNVKELIILTVPMEDKLNLLEHGLKQISDEEAIQKKLNSP